MTSHTDVSPFVFVFIYLFILAAFLTCDRLFKISFTEQQIKRIISTHRQGEERKIEKSYKKKALRLG